MPEVCLIHKTFRQLAVMPSSGSVLRYRTVYSRRYTPVTTEEDSQQFCNVGKHDTCTACVKLHTQTVSLVNWEKMYFLNYVSGTAYSLKTGAARFEKHTRTAGSDQMTE